jgi:hypothetical protein
MIAALHPPKVATPAALRIFFDPFRPAVIAPICAGVNA